MRAFSFLDPESGSRMRAARIDSGALPGWGGAVGLFRSGENAPRVLLYDGRSRAASPSIAAASPVDLVTSALSIAKHRETSAWVRKWAIPTTPADRYGAPLNDALDFYYPVWGTGHLARLETRREELAPFVRATQTRTWVSDRLERHGAAVVLSQEERQRAEASDDYLQHMLDLPRQILDMSLQYDAADLILTTVANTTYATGHQMAATGVEWDNGGDFLGDMAAGVSALTQATGRPKRMIHAAMTQSAWDAALLDPNFEAKAEKWGNAAGQLRSTEQGTDPDFRLEIARVLLGIASLELWTPVGLDAAGAYGPMLSDQAWIWTSEPPEGGQYETSYGFERWAALFEPSLGELGGGPRNLEPFEDGNINATLYRMEHIRKVAIVNNISAYQVRDCSVAV